MYYIVGDTHNGEFYEQFDSYNEAMAYIKGEYGVSMKAIQEWLGHSTFNVTANFYSHLDYSSKLTSAETISMILDGDTLDIKGYVEDDDSLGDKNNRRFP